MIHLHLPSFNVGDGKEKNRNKHTECIEMTKKRKENAREREERGRNVRIQRKTSEDIRRKRKSYTISGRLLKR